MCEFFIKEYDDWGHLAALSWWLIWRVDVEPFTDLEPLLLQGVEKGLTSPIEFKSDWQTFYIDLVQSYGAHHIKLNKDWDAKCVIRAYKLVNAGEVAINQALKSKLYVLVGKIHMKLELFEKAQPALEMAMQLNPRAGVKKLLKQCNEELEINND